MRFCDSKLRLLQTAHELIWRQSYGSVGVDQICEQSRVKKGSFYHFFRSKSELTVAAYEFYWDKVRVALDRIFSRATFRHWKGWKLILQIFGEIRPNISKRMVGYWGVRFPRWEAS